MLLVTLFHALVMVFVTTITEVVVINHAQVTGHTARVKVYMVLLVTAIL